MADHPNAQIIRDASDRMEKDGDMQHLLDLLSDDVVWHEIGSEEPMRGKAAVAERWDSMPTGGSLSAESHDVIANDDHAIQLVTATVSMGDRSITYRTAEIYHMRDGKITERWAFSDDTDRIDKFFGGM